MDLATMVYGKLPPMAKDIEENILGAMMIDPKCVNDVKELLTEEDFYISKHQLVFRAISAVSENNTVDLSLVGSWLMQNELVDEVGGLYSLVALTNAVVSSANIKQYCAIVKQSSLLRKMLVFGGDIIAKAYDPKTDVFELMAESEGAIKGFYSELESYKVTKLENIAVHVITDFNDKVYKAKNNIVDEKTIYTGVGQWDTINGPLFPGLYVIAGRPGMGKGVHMTELICRMARRMNFGCVNGEMTDQQLLKRLGCNILGLDNIIYKKNPKIITAKEQEMVQEAMTEAIQLKLHLTNERRIDKIATKIRSWVNNFQVKAVAADFLTLFKMPKSLERSYSTKLMQVDYILDIFTALCKELEIPIFLYVQMNRAIEGRAGSKEPTLSDLKQSGSIEELAFQVSFLHRPEYFDPTAVTDEFGESTKGLMYQIIAKHRDGELARLKFRSNLACSRISDWSEADGMLRSINFDSDDTDLPF